MTDEGTSGDNDWISVIDEVLDEGIDRDEGVKLTAEELIVDVPLRFGTESDRARWRFDGSVRVSVDGETGPLADWMQYWYRRRMEERAAATEAITAPKPEEATAESGGAATESGSSDGESEGSSGESEGSSGESEGSSGESEAA